MSTEQRTRSALQDAARLDVAGAPAGLADRALERGRRAKRRRRTAKVAGGGLAALAVAGAVVVGTGALGGGGTDDVAVQPSPTAAPSPTDGTTSGPDDGQGPGQVLAETPPERAAVAAVVDLVRAAGEGDLDAVVALTAPESLAAFGGEDALRADATAVQEGVGSWAAALPDATAAATTVVSAGEGELVVVSLRGEVEAEGVVEQVVLGAAVAVDRDGATRVDWLDDPAAPRVEISLGDGGVDAPYRLVLPTGVDVEDVVLVDDAQLVLAPGVRQDLADVVVSSGEATVVEVLGRITRPETRPSAAVVLSAGESPGWQVSAAVLPPLGGDPTPSATGPAAQDPDEVAVVDGVGQVLAATRDEGIAVEAVVDLVRAAARSDLDAVVGLTSPEALEAFGGEDALRADATAVQEGLGAWAAALPGVTAAAATVASSSGGDLVVVSLRGEVEAEGVVYEQSVLGVAVTVDRDGTPTVDWLDDAEAPDVDIWVDAPYRLVLPTGIDVEDVVLVDDTQVVLAPGVRQDLVDVVFSSDDVIVVEVPPAVSRPEDRPSAAVVLAPDGVGGWQVSEAFLLPSGP